MYVKRCAADCVFCGRGKVAVVNARTEKRLRFMLLFY